MGYPSETINLVDLRPLIPEAIFQPRYASSNNILGRPLHNDERMMLEERAAKQLLYASKLLLACPAIPVFWDVHRTREVQAQLVAFNNDPRYVLSPDESNHVKGLAVDMTLANPNGQLWDMGTDFDEFSEKAHVDSDQVSKLVRANRLFLANVMAKAGFKQLPTEWWHFDFVPML